MLLKDQIIEVCHKNKEISKRVLGDQCYKHLKVGVVEGRRYLH